MPHKDYTDQENKVAEILDKFGLRYEQQYQIETYSTDFYVPEIFAVIEADGIYGHLRKADRKRDQILLDSDEVRYVIHIKAQTKSGIEDEIWQALEELQQSWDQKKEPENNE